MQQTIEYIIEQLRTIDGIANIYECFPKAQNERGIQTYFTVNNTIQAWIVENARGKEVLEQNTGYWDEILSIDGWMVYEDSTTRRQMQTWVDSIKVLFAGNKTLGKTVSGRGALQLTFFQTDWFYDVLCHHCRFELNVSRIHHA